MFWLYRHLLAKQVLNSKQSAKGFERMIREIFRRSTWLNEICQTFFEKPVQMKLLKKYAYTHTQDVKSWIYIFIVIIGRHFLAFFFFTIKLESIDNISDGSDTRNSGIWVSEVSWSVYCIIMGWIQLKQEFYPTFSLPHLMIFQWDIPKA